MSAWVSSDAAPFPADVLGELGDIAVVVGPDACVAGLNHVTASVLGAAAEELIGRSIFELVHPEDMALAIEQHGRYSQGSEIFRPVLRLGRPDGSIVSVEIVSRRLERPDGVYLVLSGRVDPVINAEDLVDSLRLGVLICDRNGIVTRANQSASELMGLNGAEPRGPAGDLGGKFYELHPSRSEQIEHPLLTALATGEVVAERLLLIGVDGVRRVVDVEARPVDLRFIAFAAGVMTIADVTDRHDVEVELRRRATKDDLTGVLNRSTFMTLVSSVIDELEPEQRLGLLFCDLDRFKSINERFGHSEADELLRAFASGLQEIVGPDGIVGRLGGDEFALAIRIDNLAELEILAARLRSTIRRTGLSTIHVAVTSSVGISLTGGPRGTDAAVVEVGALIEEADEALRRAKRSGRDRSQFFDDEMRLQRAKQTAMGRLLRDRLHAGQVEIAVQPVVSMETGLVSGGEVLARIRDDEGQLIDAGRWIESAIRNGLVGAVDESVTRQACELVGRLTQLHVHPLPVVGVNFSDATLARLDLAEWLIKILTNAGADPTGFLVEIPETVFPVIRDRAADALRSFKDQGIWIAVDDFGIGYASLAEVRDLPIDTLKIDRSFVIADPGSPEEAILRASVEMARALGCRTVAEGVETDSQLSLLAELRVDYVQGYLTGRPMSADDYVALVQSGTPRF